MPTLAASLDLLGALWSFGSLTMAEVEPSVTARGTSTDRSESQYDPLLSQDHREGEYNEEEPADETVQYQRKSLFAYLRTKEFWTILLLG